MSDTFDASAHAAGEGAPAPETSAPQAEYAAETQAENTEAPAPSEDHSDESQEDARETPSRAEKRIQQLLAKEREAREEAAYYKGLAQRQQPTDAKPAASPTLHPDLAQYVGKEPDPTAFPAGEFDPAYLDARVDFKLRQREATQAMAQRQQAARQQATAFQAKVASIVEAGASKYGDFAEKALRSDVPLNDAMLREIADSDAGADVAYFLGNNPAEARRIASLPANRVAREIGRIEERLARAKDAPTPQPSTAPDPAPRVVRGGNVGQRDPSRMSMSEYAEWSRKQKWD